jgi:hypothetical protein
MYWWREFEPSIARGDFSLVAEHRGDPARIFLLWEDFQPEVKRHGMNSALARAFGDTDLSEVMAFIRVGTSMKAGLGMESFPEPGVRRICPEGWGSVKASP